MNLIERLRPGFLARSRREKLLAALFLVALAVIWLGATVTRARATSRELTAAREKATSQARWLGERGAIETRYNDAVARLSGTVLPTGEQAYSKIDEIARRSFQAFNIPRPQTDRKEKLAFHTINVSVSRSEFEQLKAFHAEVAAALPTVILDEVTLTAPNKNQANLLDAKFIFVAIEILR